VPRVASALDYPNRPIHWIIGFPPGGGADIVSRIMGRWLSERLGQQVIIENKPGAGTNIATEAVVNAPPDGYTMLWAGISNAINAMLYPGLSFDFLRDIAPVAGIVLFPLVIEAHPSVPAKSIAELVALAKANPGKITLASYGTGTISHVAGELFKAKVGVNMVHVPYRGGFAAPHPLRRVARVGGNDGGAARGLARCPDSCRDHSGIRRRCLDRCRGSARHAGWHREVAQPGNQCRINGPGHQGAAHRFDRYAIALQPRRVRRLYGGRNREVDQGDQDRGHQGGVSELEIPYSVINRKSSCAAR
jgi:hypothetical protein